MWAAAIRGRLPVVQVFVELGLDVNLAKDVEDPEDPFCTVEGPVLHAAAEGHLEVVRWLLDHGAKINYVVSGQVRCLPLLRAAVNGHLDVVKLLIERGADIDATWNGHSALTQARDYGHAGVVDYLRSKGAREPDKNPS